MAAEMIVAAFWMDVRKTQDPKRNFGKAPTAAWQAIREIVPLDGTPAQPATVSATTGVANFMQATPASTFFSGGPAMPDAGIIPMAVTTKAGNQ
jgi:histidine ammonia-lyase